MYDIVKLRKELNATNCHPYTGFEDIDRLICDYGMYDSKSGSFSYAILLNCPELAKYIYFNSEAQIKRHFLRQNELMRHPTWKCFIGAVVDETPEQITTDHIAEILTHGSTKLVKKCLDKKLLTKLSSKTIFRYIACGGNIKTFKLLIDFWDGNGDNIFWWASINENLELIKYVYGLTQIGLDSILEGAIRVDSKVVMSYYISLSISTALPAHLSSLLTLGPQILTMLVESRSYTLFSREYLLLICCEKGFLHLAKILIKDMVKENLLYTKLSLPLVEYELAEILVRKIRILDGKKTGNLSLDKILDKKIMPYKEIIDILKN